MNRGIATRSIVPYRRRSDRIVRVRRVRANRIGLGLAPDSSFLLQVAPQSFQSNMGKYWAGLDQYIQRGLRTGQLPAYTEERCASIKPVDKKTLVTSISASALQSTAGIATAVGTAAQAGAAAGAASGGTGSVGGFGPALGAAAPFLLAGAVVLGVVSAIFAHHAKAVAKEQSTMCAAVPGANDALAWIDSEFKAGHMSKASASAALDELYSNFTQYITPVMKNSGDGRKCNLACGYQKVLQAIVAKKKAEYAEAPDSVVAAILSGEGWQGILPWAAAAVAAWVVLT